MVLIDILFKLVPHHLVVLLIIGVRGTIFCSFSAILLRFATEVNIFKVTTLLYGRRILLRFMFPLRNLILRLFN
jgi:hypothetical protein